MAETPDMAATLAKLDDDERPVFIAGAGLVYGQVMKAIAAAFDSDGGLTEAFNAIRGQWDELCALIAVEGVLDA